MPAWALSHHLHRRGVEFGFYRTCAGGHSRRVPAVLEVGGERARLLTIRIEKPGAAAMAVRNKAGGVRHALT